VPNCRCSVYPMARNSIIGRPRLDASFRRKDWFHRRAFQARSDWISCCSNGPGAADQAEELIIIQNEAMLTMRSLGQLTALAFVAGTSLKCGDDELLVLPRRRRL
jgi:hypothetical protein